MRFLSLSSTYPGWPPVEVIETHMSWVFLAGELAYKAAEQDILLGPGHLFSVDLEPSPWLRFNVAWSDDDALLRFLVTLKAA